MYRFIIYLYIFFSFFISYGIVRSVKTRHLVLPLLITYWFMISPVVRSRVYTAINPLSHITGPAWRVDWQIAWLILILMLLKYLSVTTPVGKIKKSGMPNFEKFFYLYVILSILVTNYHMDIGTIPARLKNITHFYHYQLFLLYFAFSRYIDKDIIRCIIRAILVMSVISTIIMPIQFFYDTYFMRTDRIPWAFSTYNRSSGIFQYGDQHAFLVTFALYYIIFNLKNYILKVIVFLFFAFGITLTFSRGVWVTFLMVFLIHMYFFEKKILIKMIRIGLIPTIIALFVLRPYLPDFNKFIEGNDAMETRVMSDTFTPRMEYNMIVINTIAAHWAFGYGSLLDNETYYKMMYALGGKDWANGSQGGIHNLYLSELFLKGIFVATVLVIFLFLFMKYSLLKGIKEKNYLYVLSFYYVFSYALYQMTAASFLTNYAAILAIFFMAVVAGVERNNIDISEYRIANNQ